VKRFLTAHFSALAVVLFAGVSAQATPIDPNTVTWMYNFSPGSPSVSSDGGRTGVTFTNEPTKSATGSSDVVATNLRVFSADPAAVPPPDSLTGNSGHYTLALTLSTTINGKTETAVLNFSGLLTGTFSKDNANIGNAFGPNSTQTVTLDSVTFKVQLIAYTPPGPPSQANAGSISAHVTLSGGHVTTVPEPSTILLSSLGLTFLGGARWRKRRAARVQA